MALLFGIWAGALLSSGFNPLTALLRTFDTYFVGAFVGEGNAEVLLFTFLLGGTIGLVQRSGGAQGLANALKGFMGEEPQSDGACQSHRPSLVSFFRSSTQYLERRCPLPRFCLYVCHPCTTLALFHVFSLFPVGFLSSCCLLLSLFCLFLWSGTRRRGQIFTAALGCLIFFDDYSSILIVGNSLRDVVKTVGVSVRAQCLEW